MDAEDVLGFTLEAALKKLDVLGIKPTITETAPLRGPLVTDGTLRVVKQINEGENRTLILCRIPDIYR